MRRLIFVPLTVLAILLAGATCVANVEDRGDGTYAGTVVNTGSGIVHDPVAVARFKIISTGEVWGRNVTLVCPQVLLPAERGSFEFRVIGMPVNDPDPGPSTVVFPSLAEEAPGTGGYAAAGLLAREIVRDSVGKTVRVVIENNGELTYESVRLCSVQRARDGTIVSVAFGEAGVARIEPGSSTQIELKFSRLTNEAIALYPSGQPEACCPDEFVDWTSVNNGKFSVMLPPGWAYEPRQGIDSFVGAYVGDGIELTFDYGTYSDPLDYDDDPAYEVHEETIGGLTAKIVRPEGARGITGVYFSRVGKFSFPGDNIAFDVRLTIVGQDLTAEQQEIALQIFRSVRFAE